MKRIQIITGAAALLAALTACTSPKQGQQATDAVTGEDTRGECWTWYTDTGDYRRGDRVQLTFSGPAVIDATPAG